MRKFLVFMTLSLGVASVASAEKPYGAGGCGLGSVLQGKDGNQVLAITTNGTGTQTFGITSGTSNCVDSGVVRQDKEARAFIEMNQIQLANDISKGYGDTISSLAQLYRCNDSVKFSSSLKRNYNKIYPSAQTPVDHVESSIQNVMRKELSANCDLG